MELETLAKIAETSGLGILSFIALVYFGWKVMRFMDALINNHLEHIQRSLEDIANNLKNVTK